MSTTNRPSRSMLEELTPRQRQILELVVRGAEDREIAQELGISHHTVKDALWNLKRKLGVRNRTALATLYYGGVPYPDEHGHP